MSRLFEKELKPATVEDINARWSGASKGLRFRCKMCGHKFELGELWRMVFANYKGSLARTGNFFICAGCDTGCDEDLVKRMGEIEDEGFRRFWWMIDDNNYLRRNTK